MDAHPSESQQHHNSLKGSDSGCSGLHHQKQQQKHHHHHLSNNQQQQHNQKLHQHQLYQKHSQKAPGQIRQQVATTAATAKQQPGHYLSYQWLERPYTFAADYDEQELSLAGIHPLMIISDDDDDVQDDIINNQHKRETTIEKQLSNSYTAALYHSDSDLITSEEGAGNNCLSFSMTPPTQHYLTIEELRLARNSCWLCGCNWQQDHVSLDCSECGGYSLTRPCPNCDGDCKQIWKRNINETHDNHKAIWVGQCNNDMVMRRR